MTLFEHFIVYKILHAYSALSTTHVVDPGVIITVYISITIAVLKGKNLHYIPIKKRSCCATAMQAPWGGGGGGCIAPTHS
jgi:hypothetical protein